MCTENLTLALEEIGGGGGGGEMNRKGGGGGGGRKGFGRGGGCVF